MIQPSPYSAARRKVASIEPPTISCGRDSATSGPTPSCSAAPDEALDSAQTSLIRASMRSKFSPPRESKVDAETR